MMLRLLRVSKVMMAAAGLLLAQAGLARAFPSFPATVVGQYPTATNLETCGTCHTSFTSAPGLNPFGGAFLDAGGLADPAAALTAIEGADSDGDGTSNIDEINTDSGFFPGWTCATYVDAQSAPVDLANLVDPVDPGCNGPDTTTTTIIVTTTTTVPVTSTTLPVEPGCSQPISTGATPVATDCLFILQAAVGSQTCSPECICAPTGTLPAKATDALLCLKHSVGDDAIPLQCPCDGGTTTTTTGGGTTTTTAAAGTTTTTAAAGTTTTTAAVATTTTTQASATTTTLPIT
jgi:hypothetical protein